MRRWPYRSYNSLLDPTWGRPLATFATFANQPLSLPSQRKGISLSRIQPPARSSRQSSTFLFLPTVALPMVICSRYHVLYAEEGRPKKARKGFARLDAGAFMIPHPSKAWKGGEDAYFISQDGRVLGVADGVGGWGEVGIDPGLYAKTLMQEAKKAVEERGVSDTTEILAQAYEATSHVTGSSTALIVRLDGTELRASNLGDSGFLVVRAGEVVYRSEEQQHSFNFPFQLGTDSTDMPYHATRISFLLEESDTIVLGTDGLFDNLFDYEIAEIIVRAEHQQLSVEDTAKELAKRAGEAANKKMGMVPFGQHALARGYVFSGGKLDDITVIVARPVC